MSDEMYVSLNDGDFVSMTFDPALQVNVRALVNVLRGRLVVSSSDQWEDMKEQIADCLEQFLALRAEVASDGE